MFASHGGNAVKRFPGRALLAVGLLAASCFWYLQHRRPDRPADLAKLASTAKESATGHGQAPAMTELRRAPAEWPALPAVDAPLATIVGPLSERADRGDSKAACRLALELIRCSSVAYFQSIPAFNDADLEKKFEAEGNLAAADSLASMQIDRLLQARECSAVPEALRSRGAHYLAMAARAGEPQAMLHYADGAHWPMDGRGVYSDPAFDVWRREAPRMLRRAFDAGVPEAPYLYWVAYQGDLAHLSALIPDDPVRAEATRMLMMRLHGWNERPVPSTLDPASLGRARDLSQQWHEGPFKGRRYAGQERSLFHHPGLPRHDGKQHAFCTSDRLTP